MTVYLYKCGKCGHKDEIRYYPIRCEKCGNRDTKNFAVGMKIIR